MGPGASLKASTSWCLAAESKSATLGLKERAKKVHRSPYCPSPLEAGREGVMSISKRGRGVESTEKMNHGMLMGLNPTWLQSWWF